MTTRVYKKLPDTYTTYSKIIKSLLPVVGKKKFNEKKEGVQDVLPLATYMVNELSIDKSNLKHYRRICGFADNGQVPPTYFAVLSQSIQMNMMVDEPFPFAMLGLVHIANSVTQYRRIEASETVSMDVKFANLKDHSKGKQFDFITRVYHGESLIWEGVSTYLSRQKTSAPSAKKPMSSSLNHTKEDGKCVHVFEAPEDIGRRYAKISGDFNLIHLHALPAKVFGFPKAIAHGMWFKAKCLSLMDLPDAYTVEANFKLPVLLPAEVKLVCGDMSKLAVGEQSEFSLACAKKSKPHLAGTVSRLSD